MGWNAIEVYLPSFNQQSLSFVERLYTLLQEARIQREIRVISTSLDTD
jgi:hypothetical protein